MQANKYPPPPKKKKKKENEKKKKSTIKWLQNSQFIYCHITFSIYIPWKVLFCSFDHYC